MKKHHTHDPHIHGAEDEDWSHHHVALIAFILACLVVSLFVIVLSMVKVYFSTGIWPLFG